MSTHHEHLQKLADKLNGLDLSVEEDDILKTLMFGRGEEAEVSGYQNTGGAQIRGFNIGMPPTRSWSTSGDADDRPTEEVSFYYNKIEF